MKDYNIDIVTASKMLSLAPSKLIDFDNKGSIEIGKDADLLIVKRDFVVSGVLLNMEFKFIDK